MLSSNLEKTLRNAYQFATESKHEFVTLEHLLKSLTDDKDALSVLKACLLYTSPSPRDRTRSRMPSSA